MMMTKKKSYAVGDSMPSENMDQTDMTDSSKGPDESDSSDTPAHESGGGENESDTAMISAAALGGKSVKPGQSITLKVVSVDEDGNAVVRADSNKTGGIAQAASAFNEKA
jgi:hypothetical protein